MKTFSRIIWGILFVCLLFAATMAGAFALGHADGKEDCPPPPCTKKLPKIAYNAGTL